MAEQCLQLTDVRHLGVRSCIFSGPVIAVPINPGRAQTCFASAVYVVKRVISNMQSRVRAGTARLDRRIEDRPIRLRSPYHCCVYVRVEEVIDSDLAEIGITVGHRNQCKPFTQGYESGTHLGEHIDVVAYFVEYGESFLDQELTVSGRRRSLRQDRMTQKREVMHLVRVFFQNLLAQDTHILRREHVGYPRIVFTQPGIQALLGPLDDRVNFPKRVVEVERYCADAVHWYDCGLKICAEQGNEVPTYDGARY